MKKLRRPELFTFLGGTAGALALRAALLLRTPNEHLCLAPKWM